jgi:flagellar basal-body rod protein FlgG
LLEKQGHSLYASPLQKPHAGRGSVRQGAYEASAVEPITTMVDMMAATRAYEMNASMISLQDQSLGRAVNDVGRLG